MAKTVLVVDDEELLRQVLSIDLTKRGYQVLTAKNSVEASAILSQHTVHLIISDLQMSGGDGIALLRELKSNGPSVILLTGDSQALGNDPVLKKAARIFSKPFDRKELLAAADKILTSKI